MIQQLLERYPCLDICREALEDACAKIIACYENGGKLLLCGNGGSCADAEHIAGELMKGFLKKRPLSSQQRQQMLARNPQLDESILDNLQNGLPAIPLASFGALGTAVSNDTDPALVYAQPLMALGKEGDVLIGISTSGNAKNVAAAANLAKAMGITVIGLTGEGGGTLGRIADVCICAPEKETFKVQELHLPIYHYLCAATEEHFYEI